MQDLVDQASVPSVPGIGQAGVMVCPIMKGPCWKSACMLWVELTYAGGTPEERKVGNCSLHWLAVVTTEQTQAMNRLTDAVKEATHSNTNHHDGRKTTRPTR